MIEGLDKRDRGLLGQRDADPIAEFRMGIDSAPDSRAADGQFIDGLGRLLGSLDRQGDLPCESSEFLP